jgi:hypothetical protein
MSDERRDGPRFITDLSVMLFPADGGKPIDDRATAHDVSMKGFKLETEAQLEPNTIVTFTLSLPQGASATGKGKIVWSNRESFATWSGVEIVSMPWRDKRRLEGMLNPARVDWSNLTDVSFKLVMVLVVVVAASRILHSGQLREVLSQLMPKIIALIVMGWALLNLFKRERR